VNGTVASLLLGFLLGVVVGIALHRAFTRAGWSIDTALCDVRTEDDWMAVADVLNPVPYWPVPLSDAAAADERALRIVRGGR